MMSNDNQWPYQPPTAPPTAPVAHESSLPLPPDAPDYVRQTEVVSSGGKAARIVALVVGLVFLGGMGWAAVAAFSGDRAGAGSPEEAVTNLADALSNEDVVAAIEAMAPSEVGTASDLYPRVLELAVREGAIEREDWLTGVDFEVTGLETRTEELHPDVALVELVDGLITVSIDPDVADPIFLEDGRLEYSITVREILDELRLEIENPIAQDDFPLPVDIQAPDRLFLMTVKRNGGWFVSPMYTGAEMVRVILNLPEADFAASRENAAAGAATPSGVIQGIVDTVNGNTLEAHLDNALAGDPDGTFSAMNAFVPPDEAGVFLDYASSYQALVERAFTDEEISFDEFRREIERFIDEVSLEGDIRMSIDIREEPREDGSVVLRLESGSVDVDATVTNPDTGEVATIDLDASWNGLCGRADAAVDGQPEAPISDCVPTDVLPEGFDNIFLVVGPVDGDWYVSYVETVLAYIEIFLEDELAN